MSSASVLIRCDGGELIGIGHVSRCLALADELRESHACDVAFAMRDPASAGVAGVQARGYSIEPIDAPDGADYGASLVALAGSRRAKAIVIDVRDGLSRRSLEAVRAAGVGVVTIDDGSDRRLASDLAFYPPVPQVEELDWAGFAGERFAGWEWVLLKREFAAPGAGGGPTIDVLVTMGGSDPAGMTEFAIDALNLLPVALDVEVVVGPAFGRTLALGGAVTRSKHAAHVSQRPDAMAPLMRASRVAVASFGVSAYELAACGVPAVYLCLSPDHARSASAFERDRIAENLGVFPGVRPDALSDAVARLIGDAGRRMRMSARGRALVDGQGAARVARLVAERFTRND